jgi:enterochelin esterase family protein
MIASRARAQRAIPWLRAHGGSPQAVEQLVAERGVPLVEGSACTFLWCGEADAVAVEHRVVGLPAPLPLHRMKRSDVWYATVELPRASRVEYRILIRRGDDIENTLDPLNPRQAIDPGGTKSVLHGDGYETPDWAVADPAVVPGELVETRVSSRHLKRDVRVTVYLPARMRRNDSLPLIVLHDGGDLLTYAGLATVLDNLMDRRVMADSVVALTHPGDRLVEYVVNPAHSRFLNSELVPMLEERLRLKATPASRILGGASLGAIATLAAAVAAPGFYGGLLLQSATFVYSVLHRVGDDPAMSRIIKFVNRLRGAPPFASERIVQTIGAFEPSADRNRAMAATLSAMAGELRVQETMDGHNWTSWRDGLHDAFGWLLPGDARIVYP